MKRRIKIIVDVAMFTLFLYLLSYRPGMGLMVHAVVGIAQLTLFLLHHILNLNWYKALFRGRYSPRRILLTASDFLLLVAMGTMIVSSVMVSGMVFAFVPFRMTSWWRRIHVAASGWCFLLTGFHVGMHMTGLFSRLERKGRGHLRLIRIIEAAIVCAGVYGFLHSDLWPRITLARRLPLLTFTGEEMFGIYLTIVLGMSVVVHWILVSMKNTGKTPK